MLSRLRHFPRRLAVAALSRTVAAGRRLARGILLRNDRRGIAAHASLLGAGVAAGLLLALPVPDVAERCPPRGEGYDLCWVQKALLPTILVVLAGTLLAQWLALLALVRLPLLRQRVRAIRDGREEDRPEDTREPPPYARDPFLLASTWGTKAGRTARPRSRVAERLAGIRQRPWLSALLDRLRRR